MESIIEKFKKIPEKWTIKGASDEEIISAQKELNLKFPQEYIDYIKEYGFIAFNATEWTGIVNDNALNVVISTKWERENDKDFPKDCFLLENMGLDGLLVICDEEGKVYRYQYGMREIWADSLSEYLDICIRRKEEWNL